jgi:hypothetical protein
MDAGEYNVMCLSSPTHSFPNNTPTVFTVDLHKDILLDGEWEVAMTSITHPKPDVPLFSKPQYVAWKTLESEITILIVPANITTVLKAAHYIQRKINRTPEAIKLLLINGKLYLATPPIYLEMSEELALVFQMKPEFLCARGTLTDINAHKLSNSELAEKCPLIEGDGYITNRINYNFKPVKYLLIYSDFVEPSMVADQAFKLLKIVPIQTNIPNNHVMNTLSFMLLEYHTVNTSRLQYLKFRINSNVGSDLKYYKGDVVSIAIHFRRKK